MTIDYEKIGSEIGRLVSEKQKAYGDSYGNSGKILEILFPNGVKPDQYKELLAICRVVDKLFRLANDPHYGDESPWGDICGYSLLRLGSWDEEKLRKLKANIEKSDSKPLQISQQLRESPRYPVE
jgi:hypothetical protein